jgi:tetratricopeptide (TPR) repeat protein
MRAIRGLVVAVLLLGAVRPEPRRWQAERALRAATDALRFIATRGSEVNDPSGALERVARISAAVAPALPGDPRPPLVEGAARLVNGDAQSALDVYRKALTLGERGETDLNAGRALERLGREADARAAFLRAAWISPALLGAMMPDVASAVREELGRQDEALHAGRLKAPPPLPPF